MGWCPFPFRFVPRDITAIFMTLSPRSPASMIQPSLREFGRFRDPHGVSLPLDGAGRLAGDVVNDAVDPLDGVGDAGRDPSQELMGQAATSRPS